MESESSNHMACLLKIGHAHQTPGWEKSLNKVLGSMKDVDFTIDQTSKTVYVSGRFEPYILMEKIREAGNRYVEIAWVDTPKQQKQRVRDDPYSSHQYYSSNYMNYPSINPNYYYNPNQYNYHPQPSYHNLSFLPPPPPPFTRQMHPAEPIYEYFKYEPAARNFPPTPPPPNNFVMGDLQCVIM